MENYPLKQCLSGVIFVILALISDNVVRTDVNFKSKSTTIKTFENDSVLLPCYSTEPHSSVRWIGPDDRLIADSKQSTYLVPNRILHTNGSLEVTNVKLDDTGEYICEITIGGRRVITQLHSLEVQVEPEVITYPTGVMNVTLGAIFQITCEPKGVPYPIISWFHNNMHVTNTYDGDRRLTVEVKHYDMAGKIECRATNGVGNEPKSAGVILIVNFAPEIIVSNPVVHTRPGMQAKIECLVYSHPTATVHWFINGMPVNKRNNVITTQDVDLSASEVSSYYTKKRHILMIRNVRENDFGKYECKAENPLGMQSGFVTLMGNPLKPIFESKNSATTPTCKTLSWQTESQSPIIDYKFKFREVPTGNENFRKSASFMWNQLTIPADKSAGPFHTKSYNLDGLKPATVYEVMIQARNQFGPSEDSKILRFATTSNVDIINSSSTDSNEYDIRYDEVSNDIYPSFYNAGGQLTITRISFLFAVVTVLLL